MKTIIDKASSRGHANHGWLNTYHTFSFANYYNPKRMNFGALRVLNDDTVAPNKGFGAHSHSNMEVISIPLSGYLRHGDSIENTEVISFGQIQLMSTGTGIYHSEYNDSSGENVEFLQIWLEPKMYNTPPKYQNYSIREYIKENDISTFIAPNTNISILQDAWFSWGQLNDGEEREYKLNKANDGVYAFIIDGNININSISLNKRDGIGIWETDSLNIKAESNCRFLLIEVPLAD